MPLEPIVGLTSFRSYPVLIWTQRVFISTLALTSLANLGLPQTSQPMRIDEVVAVVGNEIILLSEVEENARQMALQTDRPVGFKEKCQILEGLLFQKLCLEQAERDSLTVTDEQVESELNRRLDYFKAQFESVEKMEQVLGRTIPEIKKEFRAQVKDQLLIRQMEEKITGQVKVTPAEVRRFYESVPPDSLPYIPSEVELAHIVVEPKPSAAEKENVRRKLQEIRREILQGASFGLKALLYSEDKISAKNQGELGFMTREQLVPEFASVAFRLKEGEVSEIVETPFGFHLIQLIERRGEYYNFRHILLRPKPSEADFQRAEKLIDSIYHLIGRHDTLTFGKLAELFSTDEETRNNEGRLVNPATGTTRFRVSDLDMPTFNIVNRLEPGEYSSPELFETPTGYKAFRIVKLLHRTQPHLADLQNDFETIRDAALEHKKKAIIDRWIQKKQKEYFIRVNSTFRECPFDSFKFNSP
ncbi:MAG: peptidylprolyl isomerase [Flavobacteriales bacterium]|nr:peptidylprolyl isomerase [Flavobacteriales bacterium]MDW8410642.1 peptidylprolyl isomerase [Flavobacteriales bacterium]